ncbi:unnamed protein product [Heterobilharzia americana]|nr:unnamed protein product [Heterobilharzia americana]
MQQCEANIPVNRNLMHSMLPSFSSTQDVIKSTNGYNEMVNYCTVDSDIPRFNSSRPNSINPDTEVFFSTYLPIQICYWTHQRVLDWLQSIELPEYAPKLFGSGVHGALMILEDRFTPDLLADILQISPVKSLVRRHLTNKFIELVGPDIWRRKQQSEITNPLTLHSKIKPTKKKSLFHSNRGYKGNNDSDELVCPIEIDPNHMSIFAEEIS